MELIAFMFMPVVCLFDLVLCWPTIMLRFFNAITTNFSQLYSVSYYDSIEVYSEWPQ